MSHCPTKPQPLGSPCQVKQHARACKRKPEPAHTMTQKTRSTQHDQATNHARPNLCSYLRQAPRTQFSPDCEQQATIAPKIHAESKVIDNQSKPEGPGMPLRCLCMASGDHTSTRSRPQTHNCPAPPTSQGLRPHPHPKPILATRTATANRTRGSTTACKATAAKTDSKRCSTKGWQLHSCIRAHVHAGHAAAPRKSTRAPAPQGESTWAST
jgi:hypothetical protein